MKLIITIYLLLIATSINAQLFIGYNFNFFEKQEHLNNQTVTNYSGFESICGYKFNSPYSIKLSYYMWDFEKNTGNIIPRIPAKTTKIEYNTIPLLVSRRFYLYKQAPVYLNLGLKYSATFGKDNIDTKYLSHGPGFDISISGEFNIHMVSVGTHETFELLGYRATNRHRRSIYIAWQVILTKKWINSALQTPITN